MADRGDTHYLTQTLNKWFLFSSLFFLAVTVWMMIDDWDGDGHSHTWFMLEEALPLFVSTGQFGDPAKVTLDAIERGTTQALEPHAQNFWHIDGDRESLSDFRLIIWFDN